MRRLGAALVAVGVLGALTGCGNAPTSAPSTQPTPQASQDPYLPHDNGDGEMHYGGKVAARLVPSESEAAVSRSEATTLAARRPHSQTTPAAPVLELRSVTGLDSSKGEQLAWVATWHHTLSRPHVPLTEEQYAEMRTAECATIDVFSADDGKSLGGFQFCGPTKSARERIAAGQETWNPAW